MGKFSVAAFACVLAYAAVAEECQAGLGCWLSRMRLLQTTLVSDKALDTGFFRDVKGEDGASLRVSEYAGCESSDPWRGLLLAADSRKPGCSQTVAVVKSAYPVRISSGSGEVMKIAPDSQGVLRIPLVGGRAFVCTRLAVEDVAPKLPRERFLVGASYAFPKSGAVKEETVKMLREAGIDIGFANCSGSARSKHDLLEKYGIIYAVREDDRWCGGDGSHAGRLSVERPPAWFETIARRHAGEWMHPAVVMTDVCDEPSALDFDYVGAMCARMIGATPEVMPFINIYPNYASVSWTSGSERVNQLGTATYAEHVDVYCRTVPLDYLCFDHYPFEDKAADTLWGEKRFYDNFDDVARACARTGRRLWYIGQVNTKPGREKRLTENMLRFEAMAGLAFGCEMHIWATWYPAWWTNSVFVAGADAGTFEKSDHFEKIKKINSELHALGAETILFRHVAAHYVGFPRRNGSVAAFSNDGVSGLAADDGSKLVVGEMVAKRRFDGRRALVVFAADDMADVKRKEHTIRFKTRLHATVKGAAGVLPVQPDADGGHVFRLKDGMAAIVILQQTTL